MTAGKIFNPLWWQRLRHGRGFGVHSPFAFRFILEVLNEPLPYYAYDDIDRMASSVDKRDLRLFFRLLVFFRPKSVVVISDRREREKDFIVVSRMASCTIKIVKAPSEADFRLYDGVCPTFMPVSSSEGQDGFCELENTFVLCRGFEPCDVSGSFASASCGMSFANRRRYIFAALPHLPRQHFDVRF